MVAKRRTVVTFGLESDLWVSKVPTVTGMGGVRGHETQNCRDFWTRSRNAEEMLGKQTCLVSAAVSRYVRNAQSQSAQFIARVAAVRDLDKGSHSQMQTDPGPRCLVTSHCNFRVTGPVAMSFTYHNFTWTTAG